MASDYRLLMGWDRPRGCAVSYDSQRSPLYDPNRLVQRAFGVRARVVGASMWHVRIFLIAGHKALAQTTSTVLGLLLVVARAQGAIQLQPATCPLV